MTIHTYHLKELDEVIGDLQHVEDIEDGCLALIGKIPVLLPSELSEKLRAMIGCRIGILKLSGFHVRRI